MIIIIDNYDSFTYNLYQMLGAINPDILVFRNDKTTVEEVKGLKPSHIVISPGPGFPAQAGISEELIREAGNIPVMGVCLGHQAIGEAFGGKVVHAEKLVHGKSSEININTSCPLFEALPGRIRVGRYHSLIIEKSSLPKELCLTASIDKGEIMGVSHIRRPVYGIQFHPESILTLEGARILSNFLKLKGAN